MAKTATKLADGSAGVADYDGLAHCPTMDQDIVGLSLMRWLISRGDLLFILIEFERYECTPK